ncbi:MAG: hypothetical protein VB101_09060 [Rhodospirillaceae bacterium]|nr:hypothetical protein [Rhodospirillaceae bacterium]
MTGFDAKAADQIFGGAGGGSSAPVSFDTAAADEALAADTQAMLTLNAHEAVGKSPDQVARAARLSRSTGAPIGAVMADMPWFEAMGTGSLFRSAPEATRAFLTNPVNAALAKDDVPNLSALNRAWDKLSSEFNAGIATNKLGFLGLEVMGAGLTPERQERINALRGQIDAADKSDAGMWIINNMAGPAARMVGQQIEGAPRRSVAAMTGAGAAIIAGQMGPQALIPEELVTAPVAAILGWRAQSAAESAQIEQGMAWLELNDIRGENGEPLDPTVKTGIATGVGLINGALEMVGEGAVAKPVIDTVKKRLAQGLIKYVTTKRGQSAFKNFTKAYGLAVAGETGTEVLQEITNITAEEVAKMASDGSFDRLATSEAEQEQAIDRIIDIAARTAGGMALLGIPGASIGAYSSSRTAAKAKTSEAALTDAVSAVQESKLAARDLESMAAFIRQVTEDGSLHVSAQSLSELYQSGAIDQATLDALGVTEQLPEAIAAGGDLRIAPDKYLMAVARMTPDARSQMISNTRIEADGMTAAEAEAFLSDTLAQNRDSGDLVERMETQHEGRESGQAVEDTGSVRASPAFRRSADIVRASIKNQLDAVGRFGPQVNDAYSSMMGSFYAVQAARLGVTPEDLFQRFPLKVVAELPEGGRRFAQGEEGPFGPVFTEFKGDARGAIAKLLETKSGEAIGALHHPDIGDIDLVWGREGTGGSDGYGLAKLIKYHPEVLDNLQDILSAMRVVSRSANRVNLESIDHRAGVRLTWDGHTKQWLLTAFKKKIEGGGVTTTDTDALSGTDDTASRTDASDNSIDQTLRNFYQGEKISPDAATDAAGVSSADVHRADARDVVASIGGEEIAPRSADVKTLRAAARDWYETNLRDTTVVNKSSGREVRFANAKKAFSTSANPVKLRLFAALQDVVANGTIENSVVPVDQAQEPSTKEYHWLTAWVEMDGTSWKVGVTIREDQAGNLYYNHNPIKEVATSLTRSDPAHKAGAGENEETTLQQSILNDNGGVNLYVLNHPARGSFSPATNTIALLKNADLSTFLHESGHFFLDAFGRLAADPASPNEIRADMDAALRWIGVAGETSEARLAAWRGMDVEGKRSGHEQWARGFEAYLLEGKAPSIEMQGLFQQFRAWLLDIYRSLSGLNVELTPEVRGVFDRMLGAERNGAVQTVRPPQRSKNKN